jgi:1-acyl-sn-glycerol-3-phosphate acyltransferase
MSLIGAYRRLVIGVDWTLTRLYVRNLEITGKENVPLVGPLIVVSNHLNNADPPMVALAIRPRYPMFMAKQEMINWPLLGPALRAFGAFPVRRGEADRSALRAAEEVLKNDAVLVMFPEGTRSRTASMRKGHPGTALIALRSGAPILPIGITGTEGAGWPWLFLKPFAVKSVRIVVGEPFRLPPVERINNEATDVATDLIMRRIAALLPPSYRGVYGNGVSSQLPSQVPASGANQVH